MGFVYLEKLIARDGDWCGCCGQSVFEGSELIIIQGERKKYILKEHLEEWLNNENPRLDVSKWNNASYAKIQFQSKEGTEK